MRALLQRLRGTAEAVASGGLRPSVRGVVERVPLTTLGWTSLTIGLVAWLIGARTDWIEVLSLAAGALLVPIVGVLWTLRRPRTTVSVDLARQRVVVGEQAVAEVRVHNPMGRRVGRGRVEIPVGRGAASFEIPGLAPGADHHDTFVVPTSRRAVLDLGPPRSVTADPLGAARREAISGEQRTLYVHPATVRLPALTSGLLRDLEGQTTQDLSPSDVAFHTLREYVPGDDRRHIHWRSSARVGTLMVRQFVDTRRSHLGLVLSVANGDWADDDEFEFGVQLVGSLARTTFVEGEAVSTLAGPRPLSDHSGQHLLDDLAGVELGEVDHRPDEFVRTAIARLRGVSVVLLVVGSTADSAVLRRHAERFPSAVQVVILRTEPGSEPTRQRIGRTTLLTVGDLDGLARILRAEVLA